MLLEEVEDENFKCAERFIPYPLEEAISLISWSLKGVKALILVEVVFLEGVDSLVISMG